jgi:hypothetical protein
MDGSGYGDKGYEVQFNVNLGLVATKSMGYGVLGMGWVYLYTNNSS